MSQHNPWLRRSLKMIQISKHVFALSIKLLSPDDGDSLEYHKVQRSFNLNSKKSAIENILQCPRDMIYLIKAAMVSESTPLPSFCAPKVA